MEFKIGDRVKCLGKHHSYSPDLNPIAGTKGVVIGVDNSDGQLPVRVNWDNGVLTWAFGDDVVSVLPAHKIVITTDGATTLARLYDGKKVVKSAEAKCSPSDTYDFKIGADLAYDRLMRPETLTASNPEPEKPKYKVGDKVRVVGNTRPRHAVEIGSVEKIAWLDERTVMLHTDDTKRGWKNQYVSKSDIEPYTEPPKPKYYSGKVVCVSTLYAIFTVGKVYEYKDGLIMSDRSVDHESRWYGRPFNEDNPAKTEEEALNRTSVTFIPYLGEA